MTDTRTLRGATIAFDLDGMLSEAAPDLIGAVNATLISEGFKALPYTKMHGLSSAVEPIGCFNGSYGGWSERPRRSR